jgi:hypothetical protein
MVRAEQALMGGEVSEHFFAVGTPVNGEQYLHGVSLV